MDPLDEFTHEQDPQEIFVGKKIQQKHIVIGIILFVIVLILGYFLFSYINTKRELQLLKDPAAQEALTKKENEKLIHAVSKLIELPTGLDPVVGTVLDAASLAKDQQFFTNAQNGDKVLIYEDKAIIYRPDLNKLINVGPVYLDSTSTAGTSDIQQ